MEQIFGIQKLTVRKIISLSKIHFYYRKYHWGSTLSNLYQARSGNLFYCLYSQTRFCVFNFLSILSDFLSREKLTQKWQKQKVSQFTKFQLLNDKIDQNTNFAKLPSVKWLFLYILKRNIISITQLLVLVSFEAISF